jgi:hypothetical protein
MIEPSLAAQKFIAIRLKAATSVNSLVPADSIFDRNDRPETFPCVVIGEGHVIDNSDGECIVSSEVFLDLDVWTRENGLAGCKEIAGAIMRNLRGFEGEYQGVHLWLAGQEVRYMRDPSGAHGHGVISLTLNTDGDGDE